MGTPSGNEPLEELATVVKDLIKAGERYRDEADSSASALMTTAVALGAATIAAANALKDVQRVPDLVSWIALAGLTGALLGGGAARAGVLQRFLRGTATLWNRERFLSCELRRWAETAACGGERADDATAPRETPDSQEHEVRRIKEAALKLSCTTSEIHDRAIRFKNGLLFAAAFRSRLR
jgi:hypothetical protein